MTSPVVLCTDGSDLSIAALAAGLEVLDPGAPLVLVTVMDEPDPTMMTGTGFAGGVMTPEQYDRSLRAASDAARADIETTRAALGLPDVEAHTLQGGAGAAVCAYAAEVGARAVVVGSRGRGGLKRAVLGSVSDHIVRNAPCPVLVTGEQGVRGAA
jgi:nucleotide-binding universal stress UspA family protein